MYEIIETTNYPNKFQVRPYIWSSKSRVFSFKTKEEARQKLEELKDEKNSLAKVK